MERGCPREALVQERWEVGGGHSGSVSFPKHSRAPGPVVASMLGAEEICPPLALASPSVMSQLG